MPQNEPHPPRELLRLAIEPLAPDGEDTLDDLAEAHRLAAAAVRKLEDALLSAIETSAEHVSIADVSAKSGMGYATIYRRLATRAAAVAPDA